MDLLDLQDFDFQKDLTKNLLIELFSDTFIDGDTIAPRKFDVEQVFSGRLNDGTNIKTTIGRWVFNKFCLPNVLFTSEFFQNHPITKKNYKKFFQLVANQLEFNKISKTDYAEFTDRVQWIGSQFVNTVGDSFDSKSLNLSDEVKQQIKEIVDAIDPTDTVSIDSGDKKVVDILKKALKGTPLGNIIESGAKGGWEANIKPLLGVRGLIAGEYSKDSLFGGIGLDTYSKINSLDGSFQRSVATAKGGYVVNLLRDGLNHTKISKKEDCKSDGHLIIKLTDSNFKTYKNRKVKFLRNVTDVFSPWISLTEKNSKEYIGKTLAIRSVMFCRSKDGYCQTCFGDSFKKNGVTENLSALTMLVGSNIMNKSMKAFHSTAVDRTEVDFTKLKIT